MKKKRKKKKQPLRAWWRALPNYIGMTRTILLHCPVRAGIRTVDRQSDLRILFELWPWTKKNYLPSELTKGFDLKGCIKGFCTLTQKYNGLYQKQNGVSEHVLLNNSTFLLYFLLFVLFICFCGTYTLWLQLHNNTISPHSNHPKASAPEAPTIWPRATKISNKEPKQAPKTFGERTTKFPAHSELLKQNRKTFGRRR